MTPFGFSRPSLSAAWPAQIDLVAAGGHTECAHDYDEMLPVLGDLLGEALPFIAVRVSAWLTGQSSAGANPPQTTTSPPRHACL